MSAEALVLWGVAGLIALAVAGGFAARRSLAGGLVYGGSLVICAGLLVLALVALLGGKIGEALVLPLGLPWIGARFRVDALSAFFLRCHQSRRSRGEPLRSRRRAPRTFAGACAALLSGFPRRHEPGPRGR